MNASAQALRYAASPLLRVRRWGFVRHSGVGADQCGRVRRNPFSPLPFARTPSLPAGEDTDAAIYIHLIRSGFGRGAPSRESESNAKTKAKIIKWIPAFAGMTAICGFRIVGVRHICLTVCPPVFVWQAPPMETLTTEENFKSTPPLRGSGFPRGKPDRSRAFFAKADAVGGKMRLLPLRIIPPTESLSGLRPQLFVGLPEEERPTLKGGVNPLSSGLFNLPCQGIKAPPPTPPCQGGMKRRRPPPVEGLLFFLAPSSM